MQQSMPSRKRPAPGASPLQQQQQPVTPTSQYQFQPVPDNPEYAQFDFNALAADSSYTDPSAAYDANSYAATTNTQQSQPYGSHMTPTPSTDLVRRNRNQQLAPSNGQQEQWNGDYSNMGRQDEDEQELEMKVAQAKRDSAGKRKQIPPFVQKLSSFLDSQHTDLIRWSDDGRAFIVLDEDEFARTLIPELFKHNNYASFVRQLNMYGFHKTVNITDGSLRQSEKARKGVKPPSMYSHPYFRRNRPDLLWLIQKPGGKSSKKKRDGAAKDGFDSDEERQGSPFGDRPQELGAPGGSNQDVAALPRNELTAVRQELKKLQQQQNLISRMIQQLKEQNDTFYRQATAFQALHDRHENSINAILTFLATFYNRSLEGDAGRNLVNMFSNQNNQNNTQQQSGVVEEYDSNVPENDQQVQRYRRQPQLLLTESGDDAATSPAHQQLQVGNAVTAPSSARASASPPNSNTPQPKRDSTASNRATSEATVGRAIDSPAIKNDAPTPDYLHSVPENNEVMSYIHNANANDSSGNLSFPAGLEQLQNAVGNAALTPQQRHDMMSMVQNRHGNDPSNNNALISPQPAYNPDDMMEKIRQNNVELADLENQQQHVGRRLSDLTGRLAPHSPGGIPGLTNDYGFGDPSPYNFNSDLGDMDDLVNLDGGDTDLDFLNNGTDWNWDANGNENGADNGQDLLKTNNVGNASADDQLRAAGTIESLSSEATSPAATNQFVEAEDDTGLLAEPGTPNKRQRRS